MNIKKQQNSYKIIDENTVLVDIRTKTHPTAEMLIDLADWEMLLDMNIGRVSCWKNKRKHTKYAVTNLKGKGRKIHSLILPEAIMVDHLSRDGLDNRRSNLRPVDNSTNQRNRRISSNNSSGVAGVSFHGRIGTWMAYINFDGKKQHLGYFNNFDDAVEARQEAEIEHGYI